MRGRPRQNRVKKDRGTDELQQKRRSLLERGRIEESSFAESLLGILYAHEVISKPLYEVGRFLGELGYRYEPCLGHTFRARASVFVPRQGASLTDREHEKRTKAWRRALKALKHAGPRPYDMVLKVVFYDQDLYTSIFPYSLLKDARSLRQGLECLESYFKGELKGKPSTLRDPALGLVRSTTPQRLLKESRYLAPL